MSVIKHKHLTVEVTPPNRMGTRSNGDHLYTTNVSSVFELPGGALHRFQSRMTHERPMTAREFQNALSKHADNVLTMLAGNLRDCIRREVQAKYDEESKSFASQMVLPNGTAVLG